MNRKKDPVSKRNMFSLFVLLFVVTSLPAITPQAPNHEGAYDKSRSVRAATDQPHSRDDLLRSASNLVKNEIDQVFKTLQLKEIENRLSDVLKSETPANSEIVVKDMAEKLSKKFVQSRDIVFELKRVIEKHWNEPSTTTSSTNAAEPCCKFQNEQHEYFNGFKNHVDFTNSCYNKADEEVEVMRVHPEVMKKMKSNRVTDSTLKWQHFGTQNGFHSMYPALLMNEKNCHDFDPRERPW